MSLKTSIRFFGIAFITTFLCAVSYFLLFDLVLIWPDSPLASNYSQFLLRTHRDIGQKIIVESGSNSRYAIDTALLGKSFNRTTIITAMLAGLPLKERFACLKRYAAPTDIIILPLEWMYYGYTNVADNYLTGMITTFSSHYRCLDLLSRVERVFQIPADIAFSNIVYYLSGKSSERQRALYNLFLWESEKNKNGEDVLRQKSNRKNTCKKRAKRMLKIAPEALQKIADFHQYHTARGGQVIVTWPAMAGEYCYPERTWPKQYERLLKTLDQYHIPYAGDYRDSFFTDDYIFDSKYHITPEGKIIRTENLVRALTPFIEPLKSEPIDLKKKNIQAIENYKKQGN